MNTMYLGLVAAIITTASGVPQVVRVYRTKHARDISVWQPILLNIGMTLWLIYGIAIGDLPLIFANAFSLVCYTALIIMKIRYRNNDNPPDSMYS